MSDRILNPQDSVLLVVDIQEKFLPVVAEAQTLVDKTKILLQAARALQIPTLVSEQYPKGLGRTVPELHELLPPGTQVMEKTAFGCLADEGIAHYVDSLERNQIIVCGLETHVCVNQTVHQLLDAGYEVHLMEDAVTARSQANHDIGIAKMRQSGAIAGCVEMALFELMSCSTHPSFKELQALVK